MYSALNRPSAGLDKHAIKAFYSPRRHEEHEDINLVSFVFFAMNNFLNILRQFRY